MLYGYSYNTVTSLQEQPLNPRSAIHNSSFPIVLMNRMNIGGNDGYIEHFG